MFRNLIVCFSILSTFSVYAKDVVEADGDSNSLIVLTDESGVCSSRAKLAKWLPVDGREPIHGCWRRAGSAIQIAWLDGDASLVPLVAWRPSKNL